MKKILYIIFIFLLSFTCVACNDDEYIDIAELYNKNYNEEVLKELNYNYAYSSVVCNQLILINKSELTEEEYIQLSNIIGGFDFVNIIFVFVTITDDYGNSENDSLILCVECETSSEAQKILNDNAEESIFNVTKNVFFIDYSGVRLLLEDCIEENGILYDTSKENLLRAINQYGVFNVPEGVKEIHYRAFAGENGIEELICNDSLNYIWGQAFLYVNTLKKISFNENLKYIDNNAFYGCNIEYVVIPKGVEYIGNSAFNEGMIFCEQKKKPKKWDDYFYVENAKVYWADEWEYNKYGIPCVKGE